MGASSSHTDVVTLERRDDGIAHIKMHSEPVNALNSLVFEGLQAAIADLTEDPPGAVVLSGLPKSFCWGGEIGDVRRHQFKYGEREEPTDEELEAAVDTLCNPAYIEELGHKYQTTMAGLEAIPAMVIAAVRGVAYSSGLELAASCDYRIAADDSLFASREATQGISTVGGGPVRISRIVGPAQTKRLLLGCQIMDATEAHRIGFADELVPDAEVLDRAFEFARPFTEVPRAGVGFNKRMIDEAYGLSPREAAELELGLWCEAFTTEDARTALKSYFLKGTVGESEGRAKING